MTIQQGTVAAGLVMEVITGTPNSVVAQIGDHSDTVTAPCVDGYLPTVGQTIAVVNDNGEYLAIGSTTGVVGAGVPPTITWPLANSGDQAFQPDGVANNALILQNAASAVNGLTLSGTATGVSPTLTLTGSNTDIGLTILTKGQGALTIQTPSSVSNGTFLSVVGNSGSVLFSVAQGAGPIGIVTTGGRFVAPTIRATTTVDFAYTEIALGGGAAPTVGTIGGSGPTVAAQHGWVSCTVNGTTGYFIPVWK